MARRLQLTKAKRAAKVNVLKDATIRDFTGGWNVVDNDLNLSSRFAKVLSNFQLGSDGSISVRHGTKLFADVLPYMARIVNIEYFQGHIIAVGTNGVVVKVDGAGSVAVIWNDDWASKLPGAPAGWTVTSFASFAVFRGEMVVCNGINKPIILNSSLSVTYLNDLATGSNANTPIGRYVITHNRYLVIAGILGSEGTISISSTDTSGTFLDDPAPNDAVELNLGSRVPTGDGVIKGLGRFRDKLMVAFDNALLPGTLGVFDGADHTPTFDDAIESHGSISHRVIQNIGEDMLFADSVGVPSVSRALFTGSVRPQRVSALVDPEIRKSIGKLSLISTLEDRTYSLFDKESATYLLFIPNDDRQDDVTETRVFSWRRDKQLKIDSWSEYNGWNWNAAARSELNRVFYASDTLIFLRGSVADPVTADFVGDQEMWSDDTTWTDQTGWGDNIAAELGSGIPIKFIWELPWSDNNQRFLTKTSRFINLDSEGSDSKFTISMFIDNIYDDRNDLGEDWEEDELKFDDLLGWRREPGLLNPTLSMEFVAGKSAGFGFDEFGEDFGGGRPTQREDLYAWTTKYKINKIRVEGETVDPLKIISVTLGYQQGSLRR